MSQAKTTTVGSQNTGRAEVVPLAYLVNKGLASTSRQQRKEQTKTRLISDYSEAKHHNFPENERQQRKNIDATQPAIANHHERKAPKCFDRVNFNKNEATQRHFLNNSRPIEIQQTVNKLKQPKMFESDSDSETDFDSLYDNQQSFKPDESESMTESEFDITEEINESIQDFQERLQRITKKYVHKVKSQVDVAKNKLKLQETRKQPQKKKTEQHGAGDKNHQPQSEELYQKMEMMKRECYRKIEANLTTLKNIDSVTSEIFHNYANVKPRT